MLPQYVPVCMCVCIHGCSFGRFLEPPSLYPGWTDTHIVLGTEIIDSICTTIVGDYRYLYHTRYSVQVRYIHCTECHTVLGPYSSLPVPNMVYKYDLVGHRSCTSGTCTVQVPVRTGKVILYVRVVRRYSTEYCTQYVATTSKVLVLGTEYRLPIIPVLVFVLLDSKGRSVSD